MGKSAVRVLPPLVNGKLSGILEFGVDYIDITEKTFKNEDRNFLVQIIWWGETKPLFLRPKNSKFVTNDKQQVIVDEQNDCNIKYEVRTKIKLFKSYLTKCEEVELSIVNSVNHEIIGSTFVKDLVNLVHNVECFINPIISDAGDPIGKIAGHFKFTEVDSSIRDDRIHEAEIDQVPIEKWNNNDLKINLNSNEVHVTKDDHFFQYEPGRYNKEDRAEINASHNHNSLATRSIELTSENSLGEHVSGQKTKNCSINAVSDQSEPSPTKLDDYLEKNKCAISQNHAANQTSKSAKANRKTDMPLKSKISTRKKENGPGRTLNVGVPPSAKAIHKKTNVNKGMYCNSNTLPKNKPTTNDRTMRGMKKDVGNLPDVLNGKKPVTVKFRKASNPMSVSVMKPDIKTFDNVTSEISKLSKLYLNGDSHDNHSDIENVPVKKNTKDNTAENVVTDEKSRSPSLLISPVIQSESAKDIECTMNNIVNDDKINVTNKLFFDLSDPIEKLYYETFFQKTDIRANNEFEIAELLNHPGNNYILNSNPSKGMNGTEIVGKLSVEDELQTENDINVKNSSPPPGDVRQKAICSNEEEVDIGDFIRDGKDIVPLNGKVEFEDCNYENEKYKFGKEYQRDCYRCKYYKKLSELDQIIAALKNFESKMRMDVRKDPNAVQVHECKPSLPPEIIQENENTENSDSRDLGVNGNGSDYSKEDSDFMEFRHYLSKR